MHHVLERVEVAARSRARLAEEFGPTLAHVDLARAQVGIPEARARALQREFQPFLGLGQRALGAPLVGDVLADAAVTQEHAGGVIVRLARDHVLAPLAVGAARDDEIEERQLRVEPLQVLEVFHQRARFDLDAGHVP